MQDEINILDWVRIYPYFRASNLHCYEKICTITDNSIFHYFITGIKPDNRQEKNYVWY